ncbi:MAG TPA: HD domain-containing protein [Bacillota bacterium]|jgi:hypothetical protein
MTRDEAYQLMLGKVQNQNLRKHILAVEAVMRRLAEHFGEDPDRWGLAGLLHDIDYESTKDDPDRHSMEGADMLAGMGVEPEIVEAVRTHNERHGIPRTTKMAKALFACDPLTGLIVAAALIRPEKKLAIVDAAFIMNRFGEKGFARGANRETIKHCSELDLLLDEFVGLGLEAMKGISGELGL